MAGPPAALNEEAGPPGKEDGDLYPQLEQTRREVARLRETESMYRHAAELGRWLIWSADPDGRFVDIGSTFNSITGIEDERTLKGGWIDAVYPDDRDELLRKWNHCLATGDPLEAEFRAVLADGSVHMLRSRAKPLRDADGNIARWYGISEDVQDEREAEQNRREVEERYRLAINATGDAVWDFHVEKNHLDWSDKSADLLGSQIVQGGTPLEWWINRIHPDDRERVATSFKAAIHGDGTRWSEEYRFLRSDGLYAEILDRGFIIRDEDGKPRRAVGAMADVTARKRAEAEIRRMQAELIHFSRLSAMGTMASTLAHELNQPLAALSNFISGARRLAMAGPSKQEDLLSALEAAAAGATRAGEIVRRLRDLVARGTVSLQIEHLPGLIEEAMVVASADGNAATIRHTVALDPDAEWVRADRVPVQQVLINLIRNSVEAIGDGDRREIRVTARASGDMVEVAVADTGSGIPPDQFDTIFSRFVTTKSGGMGIGLAISRTIVELHGGKIWAENRPEDGAVFRFTLPRAESRKKPAETKKE